MLEIKQTVSTATVKVVDCLRSTYVKELIASDSVIRGLALAEWIETVNAGLTTQAFDSAAVREAMMINPAILSRANDIIEEKVQAYSFTDKHGVEYKGVDAVAQAALRANILYRTAKALGEALNPEAISDFINAGEYRYTGVGSTYRPSSTDRQVLPVKEADEKDLLLGQLHSMGFNTTPNQSGLGKLARLTGKIAI